MQLIALLLVVTTVGQPPQDEPPPLEPGEKPYVIRLSNGDEVYVLGRTTDYDERAGSGTFRPDEPDAEISGRIPYEFTKIWVVTAEEREENWRKGVAEWRDENDYVQTRFADRSLGWVHKDDAKWSKSAREAALKVIREREELESANAATPVKASAEPEVDEAPGLIELWGPQAAVGLLALVLMGVVTRLLIFPSDSGGWQRIE